MSCPIKHSHEHSLHTHITHIDFICHVPSIHDAEIIFPFQIQPYHQRTFGERHHQSSTTVSSGGHHNNSSTLIPAGNQFIRGHSYRSSNTSELSEKNHHISSASMNSRHFESLMTSTHHVTSSAYDKIFQ